MKIKIQDAEWKLLYCYKLYRKMYNIVSGKEVLSKVRFKGDKKKE